MSVAIEITLEGVERLNQRFAKLAKIDTDSQFLHDIGSAVVSQTQYRLSTEKESPEGVAWTPISDEWEAQKKKTSSGGILEFGGYLHDDINAEVDGSTVSVGTSQPYGAEHQLGNDSVDKKGRKHNTPARPFLGLNDQNWDDIEAILDHRIDQLMGLSS